MKNVVNCSDHTMKEAEEILLSPLFLPIYLLLFSLVVDKQNRNQEIFVVDKQKSRAQLTQSIKLYLPDKKQDGEYLGKVTGNIQQSEYLY